MLDFAWKISPFISVHLIEQLIILYLNDDRVLYI